MLQGRTDLQSIVPDTQALPARTDTSDRLPRSNRAAAWRAPCTCRAVQRPASMQRVLCSLLTVYLASTPSLARHSWSSQRCNVPAK